MCEASVHEWARLRCHHTRPKAGSLSDLKSIGCKSAGPVHIPPVFWTISRYCRCKTVEICPRAGEFSLRCFKSDRLLETEQLPERRADALAAIVGLPIRASDIRINHGVALAAADADACISQASLYSFFFHDDAGRRFNRRGHGGVADRFFGSQRGRTVGHLNKGGRRRRGRRGGRLAKRRTTDKAYGESGCPDGG